MIISIIISCWNSEKTIKKCLESVANQTYEKTEIICVDDNSEDSTVDIINEIATSDKRVKLIRHDKNLGVSASRNDGLKIAKGDYVTFVDSDDYLSADAVDRFVDEITKNNMPDFLRYNFTAANASYKNDLYSLRNRVFGNHDSKKEIFQNIFVNKNRIPTYVWLLVIRNDIVKQIRFDENTSYLEDAIFYYDLISKAQTSVFLDIPLYHYVENGNSLTRSVENIPNKIRDILYLCEKISGWDNLEESERKTATARLLNLMSVFLLKLAAKNKTAYKETLRSFHSSNQLKRVLRLANMKEINLLKRAYLELISSRRTTFLAEPFLWIAKIRYN